MRRGRAPLTSQVLAGPRSMPEITLTVPSEGVSQAGTDEGWTELLVELLTHSSQQLRDEDRHDLGHQSCHLSVRQLQIGDPSDGGLDRVKLSLDRIELGLDRSQLSAIGFDLSGDVLNRLVDIRRVAWALVGPDILWGWQVSSSVTGVDGTWVLAEVRNLSVVIVSATVESGGSWLTDGGVWGPLSVGPSDGLPQICETERVSTLDHLITAIHTGQVGTQDRDHTLEVRLHASPADVLIYGEVNRHVSWEAEDASLRNGCVSVINPSLLALTGPARGRFPYDHDGQPVCWVVLDLLGCQVLGRVCAQVTGNPLSAGALDLCDRGAVPRDVNSQQAHRSYPPSQSVA